MATLRAELAGKVLEACRAEGGAARRARTLVSFELP